MKGRLLFQILALALIWAVLSRLAEIEKLIRIVSHGVWEWILAGAVLQLIYYVVYASVYRAAFETAGVSTSLRRLIPLTFSAIFLNVVAPAGGSSGAALLIDDARRRGQSAARAAVGVLLAHIADFTGFVPVLILGLIFLALQHELQPYQIASAAALLALIGGMAGLLMLGLWRPAVFQRVLAAIQRSLNSAFARLRLKRPISEDWSTRTALEISDAALTVADRPGQLGKAILMGLAGYGIDLVSLYCVFRAFRQTPSFGMLVACLSIGVLFWIVAITPQGIGVVEGTMALVLISLGVQAETSTVIAVTFRGLAFWIPLLIGFILARRLPSFGEDASRGSDTTSMRLVSVLTAALGIVNILSGITPSLHDRLQLLMRYSPFGIHTGGHLTTAMAGFALLLLADGLWRRKQTAWVLTVAVLAITIPAHLVKGLDYEEAILAAALLSWLIPLRAHFHARSDPPSIRQGLRAVLAAFTITLLYGVAGFYVLDRHFSVNFGLAAAARQTVVMFTQFYDPGLEPITGFGRYFATSIYAVGVLTTGYALLMLIRPVLARHPATVVQRAQARSIIEAHGRTSLARLALLPDKLYHFSAGGSVIPYVVQGRVALTLGDPIGPFSDVSAAVAEFTGFCNRNDWQPCFYQVLPDFLETYKDAGLSSLCIGHEGIVDLDAFTLSGGENKNLRSGFNKLARLGYKAELVQPPHAASLLAELREVSTQWLTFMHGTEKRFSLGWFDESYLNENPIMLVREPQGTVDAFANILAEFQAPEVTVDLMRHRRDAAHGHMDFLFASLLDWARQQGYRSFNLGLSALSGIGEKPDDPTVERTLHYVYEHLNQFYNFKGLHEYKEKFHPVWSPRYLIVPGTASLPAAALALIRADQGSGLIAGYF
ncbi:MAG TPA: flippase-like domain-containing protein [Anaerolineales bacterium]|nr:flippase-like domain-containing protein [Anaerolineales bacterium]